MKPISTDMFRTVAVAAGVLIFGGAVGAASYLWMGGAAPGARNCPGGVVGAAIGGPFELTDQTGKRFSDADLKGEPSLLYFGYATCPDICPTELADTAAAADILKERGMSVRPVFITVDPERDKGEALQEYVSYFHDDMLGLTGTPEEIAAAAKAYRVYYAKSPDPDFPDGYAMDHSSYIYLLDEDANFITYFKYADSPETIAQGVACHIG